MADKPEVSAPKEDKRPPVTILNQRVGVLILGPDPREKGGADRRVPAGSSVEVTAAEADKLLTHRGLVDMAKLAPALGNQLEDLRKKLADAEAENAKLRKAAGEDKPKK